MNINKHGTGNLYNQDSGRKYKYTGRNYDERERERDTWEGVCSSVCCKILCSKLNSVASGPLTRVNKYTRRAAISYLYINIFVAR